jgi:hypothetical protein
MLTAATPAGYAAPPATGVATGAGSAGTATPYTANSARAVFLTASLSGANEVPAADPDGRASELVRIQGDQVCFAVQWSRIAAPTAHHIHRGAAGVNGPVVVPFFGSALPPTLTAAAGCLTVADAALLASIVATPEAFYVNLHNTEFPGGAVRAQLHRLGHLVDLRDFVSGRLLAIGSGGQEVPGPGDPDGSLLAAVSATGTQVRFAEAWQNIAAPVAGHIHSGARGVSGPVVVPFFAAALPATLFAVAGTVTGVDAALVTQINQRPGRYYVNLHTADFPAGAVRGQLFRLF